VKQQKQSGFAHIVILTVILGIAVVGLLGFVYYQNFIQKKNDSSKTINTTMLTETASIKVDNVGFSVKYPKDWTYDGSNMSSEASKLFVISSPDKKVQITAMVYKPTDGYAMTCVDSNSNVKVVDSGNISSYEGIGFVFYRELSSDSNAEYFVGAQKLSKVATTKTCESYWSSTINLNDNYDIVESLGVNVNSLKDDVSNIEQIMNSDDYIMAREIIQSMSKN